jgi:hypothetical protein
MVVQRRLQSAVEQVFDGEGLGEIEPRRVSRRRFCLSQAAMA